MTMTKSDAEQVACAHLKSIEIEAGCELVLLHDSTIERRKRFIRGDQGKWSDSHHWYRTSTGALPQEVVRVSVL